MTRAAEDWDFEAIETAARRQALHVPGVRRSAACESRLHTSGKRLDEAADEGLHALVLLGRPHELEDSL